ATTDAAEWAQATCADGRITKSRTDTKGSLVRHEPENRTAHESSRDCEHRPAPAACGPCPAGPRSACRAAPTVARRTARFSGQHTIIRRLQWSTHHNP